MMQKISAIFFTNWISKIVSLLLAVVIWLTIYTYLEKKKNTPVPGPERYYPTGEDPDPGQVPIPKFTPSDAKLN